MFTGTQERRMCAWQELFALEDLVADYVELKMSTPGQMITEQMLHASPWVTAASKLHKLVSTSLCRTYQAQRTTKQMQYNSPPLDTIALSVEKSFMTKGHASYTGSPSMGSKTSADGMHQTHSADTEGLTC